MPLLSVIVPAYNEADNIVGALEDVVRDVAPVVPDLEVIVVDDGSRDRTRALAEEFAKSDHRIRVVSQPNLGHGPALMTGLDHASGEWVFLLDSDRQVQLETFADHWPLTAKYDAILGLRRPRFDPKYRQAISFMMRNALNLILGVRVEDGGCPYKLVRMQVWRDARANMPDECWIPSVLLAAEALRRRDLKVLETPIRHRARDHGPSTLNVKRLARFCRKGVSDILFFRNRIGAAPATAVGND